MNDVIKDAFADMQETAGDYLAQAEEIAQRKKNQRAAALNVVELARQESQPAAPVTSAETPAVTLEQLTTRIPLELRRTLKQAPPTTPPSASVPTQNKTSSRMPSPSGSPNSAFPRPASG